MIGVDYNQMLRAECPGRKFVLAPRHPALRFVRSETLVAIIAWALVEGGKFIDMTGAYFLCQSKKLPASARANFSDVRNEMNLSETPIRNAINTVTCESDLLQFFAEKP